MWELVLRGQSRDKNNDQWLKDCDIAKRMSESQDIDYLLATLTINPHSYILMYINKFFFFFFFFFIIYITYVWTKLALLRTILGIHVLMKCMCNVHVCMNACSYIMHAWAVSKHTRTCTSAHTIWISKKCMLVCLHSVLLIATDSCQSIIAVPVDCSLCCHHYWQLSINHSWVCWLQTVAITTDSCQSIIAGSVDCSLCCWSLLTAVNHHCACWLLVVLLISCQSLGCAFCINSDTPPPPLLSTPLPSVVEWGLSDTRAAELQAASLLSRGRQQVVLC